MRPHKKEKWITLANIVNPVASFYVSDIRFGDCLRSLNELSPDVVLALEGFLPAWDMEKRHADVAPIVQWTLQQLRDLGYSVEDLALLHEVMTPEQARSACKVLGARSLAPELRRALHQAVLQAIPELPRERTWVQTSAHYRILLPSDTISPVPPHTDFGFGHRLSERNIWIPLTNVDGPSALHVLPFVASLQWMARSGQLYGVFDDMPPTQPVAMRIGEILLFTPLHIHRGFTPKPNECRVSIDIRLIPGSDHFHDMTFSPLRDVE